MIKLLQILTILALSLSCTSTPPAQAPAPEQKARTMAISIIEQELPQGLRESWEIVTVALEQQDIPIAEVVEEELLIITEWIPMTDSSCNTRTAARIPLQCNTQYRLALRPLDRANSLVRIRYKEDCDGEHLTINCPNSNAEQQMISLIGDIKALAGVR